MRIPEQKIEEIRSAGNIVDVISAYVQIKKRGKNYVGLCPFHQEKTPSFTVSNEKQIYHCFGCHAGGNVFKFLMEYKSISFVEAVQEIAEYLGISIKYEKGVPSEEQNEQELLYEINTLTAKYFVNNLQNTPEGEVALKYLKDRNIKPQTQKIFGLGFAFPEWEHFLHFAEENKIDLNKAQILGLLDKRVDGSLYDKLRGRIIFPIFSPNGRVIAFGGRILEAGEKAAKYINSPESIIYLKRKSLFGLFQSKEEIRKLDKAILVEGYMDLVSLYQHGIKNVVASSGTSLTEEQVQLLSRFTKNIIVLFDADPAGQKASMRSIEILLKQDFDVKVVSLPKGEDPDSYINNYGMEQFEEVIISANNFLEYQTAQYETEGLLEEPETQVKAIRELVKSAALVSDELKRNLLLKSISRKFNLREKLLESELEKFLNLQKKKFNRVNDRKRINQVTIKNGNKISSNNQNGSKLEREIIKLLFEGVEEIVENIFDSFLPEDFYNKNYRYLAKLVYDSYKDDSIVAPAILIDKIENDELKNLVLTLSLKEESISKRHGEEYIGEDKIKADQMKYVVDIVKKIKIQRIDNKIKKIHEDIQSSSDTHNPIELLKLKNELQEERKTILKTDENNPPS